MSETTTAEIEEAERRLAALPSRWVTPELTESALRAAQASAFAAAAAMSLVAARQAVEAAFREQDLTAVNVAASMVTTAEWVIACLPSLSPVHVDGAADVAVAELQSATRAIPPDPVLASELELAAWRTWQFRTHPDAVGPIELPAEKVLSERLQAWRMERRRIVETVDLQSGAAFSSDSLDQLERLASLLPSVQSIAEAGAAITGMVEAANAEREAAGLTWNAQPSNVPYSNQVDSAELRALAKFRAQRQAVLAC